MTTKPRADINHAAYQLFQYAWARPTLRRSFLPVAVRGLCLTIDSDIDRSTQCIRAMIAPESISSGNYDGLYHLAQELTPLFEFAPQLSREFYRSVFTASEPPDTAVPIGDSQILAMTSTVRQNFQSMEYQLGAIFPKFLMMSPSYAIPTLCEVLDAYISKKGIYKSEKTLYEFLFRDKTARLMPDASSVWDDSESRQYDAPVKMLHAFQLYVEHLLNDGASSKQLEDVLDLLVRHNQAAAVWRRLLRVGARHPKTLVAYLDRLAIVPAILISPDTSIEAGAFLREVFEGLSPQQRADVENAITGIPSNGLVNGSEYAERIRNRLLGCLPEEHLVTAHGKELSAAMRTAGGIPPNEPEIRISTEWTSANDDWYLDYQERQGIPVREAQNAAIKQIYEPIRAFANSIANRQPTKEEAESVWQQLVDLSQAIETADALSVHLSVKNDAIGFLATACERLAHSEDLLHDDRWLVFIRSQLLAASTNLVPEYDEDKNAQFDATPSWGSPSARIEAAQGLPLLCRIPGASNGDVVNAIERLSADGANSVRFMIAERLRFLFIPYPDVFWRIAIRIAEEENSHPILVAFVNQCLSYLPVESTEQIAQLSWRIFERVDKSESSRDAGQSCLHLFVTRYLRSDNERFKEYLFTAVGQPKRYAEQLLVIPGSLRHILGNGINATVKPIPNEVRLKAWHILESLTLHSVDAWNEVRQDADNESQANSSSQPADTTLHLQKCLYHILDGISAEVYFSSSACDYKQGASSYINAANPACVAFLQNVQVVVRTLASVGLPSVTHHVIEFLAAYADVDPKSVFISIADVVLVSEKGGYQYEALAADLIVGVVERYLAGYRHILRGSQECQEKLVQMLDIFVSWPSARKLTYRLGEIYQ